MSVNQTVKASAKNLRVSPRKLNLVATSIRNMKVAEALLQLRFSKKRIANEVYKCLFSAMSNAENNEGLDVENLYVKSATVGKAFVIKRFHARGRGRSAKVQKFFSNLYLEVTEKEEGK